MSLFGRPNFGSLRAEQSAAPPPVANRDPLLRPEEAPSTVSGSFPADFGNYRFIDSRIATFPSVDPATGETVRRRGIIAHMAAESGDPNGAHSSIDSFYTAQDLRRGGHPEADRIITVLNMQTDTYIIGETRKAPVPAQTGTPVAATASSAKTSEETHAPYLQVSF